MTPRFRTASRWIVGAIFLVAGALKLAHPELFFADLLGYRVPLPEMALRLVAVTLPWLELLCGLGLLANRWPETIRPLVTLLCVIFVLMLGQAVARGLDLNCGCLGAHARGGFARPDVALARALGLLALALVVAVD